MHTFKVLSALLSYPDADLQAAAGEFPAVLEQEGLLSPRDREALSTLIAELGSRSLMDLQERYVLLFDRSRALSLHLFEHVHGESRDRGQAMVTLLELYREHGLDIGAKELPDYLPLFLEFLSQLPAAKACPLLAEPLAIITALRQRLAKRGSVYAHVFGALEILARTTPDAATVATLMEAPDDDPNDTAALDRAWAEDPVTFGPTNGADDGCPRASAIVANFSDNATERSQ